MKGNGITYAASGVDIDLKSQFIDRLVAELRFRRKGAEKPVGVGHFTSTIPFGKSILTLGTDGVGSKLLVAKQMNRWDTVGIDCVAMNVNDTICVGAEPIALVDYIALPYPDTRIASEIGKGLNKGASLSNAEIVGGEVAVLKDMVNDVDISASCLGVVERKKVITGNAIRKGDEIVGIASSGLHSNGYTLVRKLLSESGTWLEAKFGSGTLGKELLRPTEIYVKPVLDVLKKHNVTGLANVTGGGFRNILRLKRNVRFLIDSLPRVPRIFQFLSELGGISDEEMFQTFNMGTGFVVVARKGEAEGICRTLGKNGKRAYVIGSVQQGDGVELEQYGVSYRKY